MPITTIAYFTAKYKLPNTAPSDPEGADLAVFIADYESEFLTEVLGYKTAKDFIEAVETPVVNGKWFDLWKGAEFTDKHGRLNKWPGFENTQDLNPIAMYIYYKWQKERQTYSSGSGERTVLTENSVPAMVRGKLVRAWNDMVKMCWILDDFLTQGDYPDYPGINGCLAESTGNIKYFTNINIFNV